MNNEEFRMNLQIFKFNDFSIGKKLFSGFLTLILITIGMSLFSVYSLKLIESNAMKTSITNRVGDLLDVARRNRLVYMQNGDERVMEKNGKAIQEMKVLLQESKRFKWKGDNEKNFQNLIESVDNYSVLRSEYHNKNKVTLSLEKEIEEYKTQQYINAIHSELRDDKMDLALREKLFDILLSFTLLSSAGDFVLSANNAESVETYEISRKNNEDIIKSNIYLFPDDVKLNLDRVWSAFKNHDKILKKYLSSKIETNQSAEAMGQAAQSLNDSAYRLIQSQASDNKRVITDTIVFVSILTIIAIICGLLAAWYITRKITLPILQNLALSERISSGDLTAVITSHSKDELGRLTHTMGMMNEKLCEMITGIRESVSHLASASSQIAAGNIDLAARTEQQSAAVVETASSMEELTSTVRLNSDNAIQASQLATDASADAIKGGEIVNDVVSTMNGIATSSKKITDIISVINGIAFQTNILALNAAVEAARAGEQGRGFAVVAGEVRTLAQRSANAAKEIESLINESVDRIECGTQLVNKAGLSMENIVQSVTHVSQIIEEISNSSNEQRQGIEQIGKAITEMDSTTQQNATLVQESSAAAISLELQAKKLNEMVSIFKVPLDNTEKKISPRVLTGNLCNDEKTPLSGQKNSDDWTSF